MRLVLKVEDAPDDAVHLVSLGEQQLGQVGAVLAGDAGDQRASVVIPFPRLRCSATAAKS